MKWYLRVEEDGSITQVEGEPGAGEREMVADGTANVVRARPDGSFEELQPDGSWCAVDQGLAWDADNDLGDDEDEDDEFDDEDDDDEDGEFEDENVGNVKADGSYEEPE